MAKFRIQPHVRLQEWVAEENGFFVDEGLDYELDSQRFAGSSLTTSPADASVQPADHSPFAARSGAFENMAEGRSCDVSAACHWAVNAAASGRHGKMWGKAYSVCNSAIFVSPRSRYEQPSDLANVAVGVGFHSGSHYSAIQALERFVDRSEITLDFVGRPFDRVRLMQRGQIEAANVWGAQYYILEQLGFRKLLDTTFIMGFMVAADASVDDLERYFNALRRAQREIDLEPEACKHHWLKEIPEDIADLVDVRQFGPGERVVSEPYTREMFERTHRWMDSWALLGEDAASRPYDEAVIA